jgi:hypothetical protein
VDLVLFNRQGLEFVIVPIGWGAAFGRCRGTLGVSSGALTPPRAVAVRELRYCKDSLGTAFRLLFGGHRVEQAQIVTFDGEAATPRLKVADGAMFVQ